MFQRIGKKSISTVCHKESRCYIIFDVKTDLSTKTSYIDGGNLVDTNSSITYASLSIQCSVHISYLVAAPNNLDILDGDIQNAYINDLTTEKLQLNTDD